MALYCLFDNLAKKSSPVFEAPSDEVAIRSFKIQLQSIPEIARQDFDLRFIADFDPTTARIPVADPAFDEGHVIGDLSSLSKGLESNNG